MCSHLSSLWNRPIINQVTRTDDVKAKWLNYVKGLYKVYKSKKKKFNK